MTFKIRSNVKTYKNGITEPAAVFDRSTGVVFAIGDADDMKKQYDSICGSYISNGYGEMAEPITYMDLPKDQEEIDKVFQVTGYVKELYKSTLERTEKESAPTTTN